MKTKKKAKANRKLVIGIFAVSVVLLLVAFFLNSAVVLEKKEIPSSLTVSDRASFELNKEALTFGKITPGSSSQRDLQIQNTRDFPIRVEFESVGNITKFLSFEKSVRLDVGEVAFERINAIVPSNQSYGDYSGVMVVTIKRDVFG